MSRDAKNREALKALRERRGAALEQAQARLKEQTKLFKDLTRLLQEEPRTVPALAEAMKMPTERVFWHLIALKKYGPVVEADQEGDYFRYRLSEQP